MAQYTTQALLVSSLRSQLSSDKTKALKALVTIFNHQTEDEKLEEHTRHSNNVGFNHKDAQILTSIAKQYLETGHLTPRQVECVMSMIPKYASQLIRHSLASGKIRKENGFYVW